MSPWSCGYLGDARHACKCNPMTTKRYLGRISGPLLDRADLVGSADIRQGLVLEAISYRSLDRKLWTR